jgi:hypothetical protein
MAATRLKGLGDYGHLGASKVLSDGCKPVPKEMHIQDAPLTIREVRHVIVEAIKAGDKEIDHDKIPAIEDKPDRES